ncbi:hypothetical protein niasHS_005692 [Heterodera schachtii]|uniref:Uncharacterized protein n=1 Tax=Heterodera schachtii TaxID=97005 RepID=A0ABD2JZU9_HETSC
MITVKVNILFTSYNGFCQPSGEHKMTEQMCRISAERTVGQQIEAVMTYLANVRGEVYENAMCWMRDFNGQKMDENSPIMDERPYEMDIEIAYA